MPRLPAHVVFEIVYERIQHLQTTKHKVGAIRPDASASGGPQKHGNIRSEYVADFWRAGRAVLQGKRMEVFETYYLGMVPYKEAIAATKIKEGTFDRHCWEIKRRVGKELRERQLFPPRRYREKKTYAQD